MRKLFFLSLFLCFTLFVSAQKNHFGMFLGYSYNLNEITAQFETLYGNKCMCGSSGSIYSAMIFSECDYKGVPFDSCDVYFSGNKFWKIIYKNIKVDENQFLEYLQTEYEQYAVSENEFRYGDVSIIFKDGDLHFVSNKVTRSLF